MGGLAGNLYDLFNVLGEIFFTFLIGIERANRSQFQDRRVRTGGFLVFAAIGWIVFELLFTSYQTEWFKDEWSFLGLSALALLAGLGTGLVLGAFLLASILINQVRQIEWEKEEEGRQAKLAAELEQRRELYRKDLIKKGMDPIEAQIKAQQIGGSGCVLALTILMAVILLALLF